ncbi:hypothetical protein GOV10_02755 [Candidatus Woesearchaeota archaeon]|nr:hypothetical protein [Candidatus Woesearchaeota archaeon]
MKKLLVLLFTTVLLTACVNITINEEPVIEEPEPTIVDLPSPEEICPDGMLKPFEYQGKHLQNMAEVREMLEQAEPSFATKSDEEIKAMSGLIETNKGMYGCVKRFLPNKCVFNPPFSCGSFKVTEDNIEITVINNAGVKMERVYLSLEDCGEKELGTMENGEKQDLVFSCTNTERYKGEITIEYMKAGESVTHHTKGELESKVEE